MKVTCQQKPLTHMLVKPFELRVGDSMSLNSDWHFVNDMRPFGGRYLVALKRPDPEALNILAEFPKDMLLTIWREGE